MEFKELNMDVLKRQGKVIGYFERYEMHWDFSDPGKPVMVPKLEAGY